MNNAPATKQVIGRFFAALDAIIERGDIAGIKTYCTLYGIDRRNLYQQKKDFERSIFQVSWLYPLATEYGVNSHWLLTGIGNMFDKN